jgi:hypothetical protein
LLRSFIAEYVEKQVNLLKLFNFFVQSDFLSYSFNLKDVVADLYSRRRLEKTCISELSPLSQVFAG